jgi:hypothetical protein
MQGISRRTFLTLTGAGSTAAAYAKRLRDAGVAVKAIIRVLLTSSLGLERS